MSKNGSKVQRPRQQQDPQSSSVRPRDAGLTTVCGACLQPFQAKTRRAKYCSTPCRTRAFQQRRQEKLAEEAGQKPGPVESAARAKLVETGRLETIDGAAALALARRLDRGADTGSAIAAMVRELRTTLDVATAGTTQRRDPLDEIAAKREERLARSG